MINETITDSDKLRIIHCLVSIEIGAYQKRVLGIRLRNAEYPTYTNERVTYIVKPSNARYFARKDGNKWVLTDNSLHGQTWTFGERTSMTKFVKRNLL